MKTLSVICLTLCAVSLCALAQIHNEINPPEKNAEILKIKQFIRYDSEIRPFTKDEIQKFCDYIYDNPITKDIDTHHRVPIKKIDVTEYLYQQTKDEDQKKKLLDLLMAMFTEIQTARDALGIDPLDPEEGYLYFDNSPPEPKKVYKNPVEEMMDGQRKMNAFTARMNEASLKINDLVFIQGYLHRKITDHLKIPLPQIPIDLKRSPKEKARTKDILEKQAAARGRKKPEPKVPVPQEN